MNQDFARRESDAPAGQEDWQRWLAVLGRNWFIVLIGTTAGLLLSLLFLHLVKPRYDAYLQLVPVERNASSISRNLSGLASLAGINLVNEPASQFSLALETMTGRDVAAMLADDDRMLKRMFWNQWDASTRRWHPPEDGLKDLKAFVKTMVAMPVRTWARPDAADVQEFITRRLSMEENKQRGLATLILTHEDPVFARDLLQAVYLAADFHLRDRMDRRTTAYIGYLSTKLGEVTLTEHRQALAQALADQEQVLMMARSGQPFSADPLGDIAVTDRPSWPSIPLVLAIGLLGGTALGVGLAFLRDHLQSRRFPERLDQPV